MCVMWIILLREMLPEYVGKIIREIESEYGVGSLLFVNVSACSKTELQRHLVVSIFYFTALECPALNELDNGQITYR